MHRPGAHFCAGHREREATIGKVTGADAGRPVTADWLLAEAVRYYETDTAAPSARESESALARARALTGPIGAKVVARANALPEAPALAQAVVGLWSILRGLGLAGMALAGLAGAATARTAFASADGTTINIFWLLAGLLGLHAVSFVVWLALMLAAPRHTGGGLLGNAVLWLWRQSAERIGANAHRMAALRALAARWGRGRAGRWLASSLSHGLWSGYLLGALAMALALLSAQQYVFVWETTILDASAYLRLTELLAALPAALGVAVPDRAAVLAAQWSESGPGAGAAGQAVLWSSLLIWSIVLYGLLPRGLALIVSTILARRSAAAPPDFGSPYYARLVAQLSPMVGAIRVIDTDGDGAAPSDFTPDLEPLPPAPPPGPVYLLGWEIDPPETGWPPPGTPDQVRDLGRRDGRAELDEAIAALAGAEGRPGRLVVALDLKQTPDRGVTAVLAALHAAAKGRLVIAFSGAGALEGRMPAADAATRIADWVAAGLAAGVAAEHMVSVDLAQPGDGPRGRLAQLLEAGA